MIKKWLRWVFGYDCFWCRRGEHYLCQRYVRQVCDCRVRGHM